MVLIEANNGTGASRERHLLLPAHSTELRGGRIELLEALIGIIGELAHGSFDLLTPFLYFFPIEIGRNFDQVAHMQEYTTEGLREFEPVP